MCPGAFWPILRPCFETSSDCILQPQEFSNRLNMTQLGICQSMAQIWGVDTFAPPAVVPSQAFPLIPIPFLWQYRSYYRVTKGATIIIHGHSGVEFGPAYAELDQIVRTEVQTKIQKRSSTWISFLEWAICEMRSELIWMGLDTHCMGTCVFKPVARTSLQEAPIGSTMTSNGGYS